MDYRKWTLRANALLAELMKIDFGYPLGENVLHPPATPDEVAQSLNLLGISECQHIQEFYEACNGISWPDVHNGYFLKSLSECCGNHDRDELKRVVGAIEGDLVIFGSTGGGGLFGIRQHQLDVLVLPPGKVENSTYYDTDSRSRVLASNFDEFTELLVSDLEAFVFDTPEHNYVA